MGPPTSYALLLFPGFQLLDAAGPLEVVNDLSCETNITLSILAQTLDPVSTKLAGNPILNAFNSDCGPSIVPTHTLDSPPKDIDVLIVPGGLGTRDFNAMAPVIEFLRTIFPSLKYMITVCTGSLLAARSGVLDGRRATSNKNSWEEIIALRPQVQWVRQARWIVDENVWTASGVSAGIDCTLAFVEEVYGRELAIKIAKKMEYSRNERWDNDPFS